MSQDLRYDEYGGASVAAAPVNARVAFLRRTYGHLAGAILAFVGLEAVLLASGLGESILQSMRAIPYSMVLLMVLFIGGGYAARAMARSSTSNVARYAGLGLYVLLQAVIFMPILWFANTQYPGEMIPLKAGIVTLAAFAGLTFAVATTKKDFSFLGPFLWVASFVALAVVIVALFFPGSMGGLFGVVFSGAMVLLAAGYILYDTSNIMRHYRTDQHVSAALELFADVALMFYYVLRLFLSFRNN